MDLVSRGLVSVWVGVGVRVVHVYTFAGHVYKKAAMYVNKQL